MSRLVGDATRHGFVEAVILIGCTLAAVVARLYHLGAQILGGDELHVLRVLSSTPWPEIPRTIDEYDYSIPLGLLYGAVSRYTALDECLLRAPMVLFGALTPLAAWYAFRPLVPRALALALALVVAIHPFCVFYGRFVRPYGIVLVLLLVAFGFLVRAFERASVGRRAPGLVAGAVSASTLALWLSVPALFGWAGITGASVAAAASERSARRAPLWRIAIGCGASTLLLTFLLYLPALEGLREYVLRRKAGQGELQVEALLRTSRVLVGSVHGLVAACALGLALLGGIAAWRRRRATAVWVCVPIVVVLAWILVSRPLLVEYDLVMARYAFPALPFLAVAALLGMEELGALLSRAAGIRAGLATIVVLLLLWSGFALSSLRSIYGVERAYAHHGHYQAYEHSRAAERGAPPLAHALYHRIGAAPLVLEWPPPAGFKGNLLHLGQEIHRRPLKLLVQDEQPFAQPFLALHNVVTVGALDAAPPPAGTVILLHKNPGAEGANLVAGRTARRAPVRDPADLERLMTRLAARYGEPEFEDRYLVLFRIPEPGPGPVSGSPAR